MVSTLTHNSIFGGPLLSKTFLLGVFADRTASLPRVKFIKQMPSLAVRLLSINSPHPSPIKYVFPWSNSSKMTRLNTISFATHVVYHHAARYISHVKVIRDTVRSAIPFLKKESSVPVFIQRALPQEAVPNFFPLAVKSLFVIISEPSHVSIYSQ